jgi:hypothetical protein
VAFIDGAFACPSSKAGLPRSPQAFGDGHDLAFRRERAAMTAMTAMIARHGRTRYAITDILFPVRVKA